MTDSMDSEFDSTDTETASGEEQSTHSAESDSVGPTESVDPVDSVGPTETRPGRDPAAETTLSAKQAPRLRKRRARPRPQLERGAVVGRLMVLDLLGRGGMGEVYAAYDPELDRKVAVKLLQTRPGSGRNREKVRQRLLREAQALARLNHPNVITAYDVGSLGDQVYLSMEHVEGQTSRDWLRQEPRSPEAIIEVFVQAGRGLAAAHAAGLVHRDFKPSNVMVADDGRVLVLDFGLARAREGAYTLRGEGPVVDIDEWEESPSTSSSVFDNPLTLAGSVLGTPAYMAPEQARGEVATARTDQFGFCVALYEALYRSMPFPHRDSDLLLRHTDWQLESPPLTVGVPNRMRRILTRGLSVDPAERYPDLDTLLQELVHDPWKTRWRLLAALGMVLVVAFLGFLWWADVESHRQLCTGAPERLAGIWDGDMQDKVEARFLSFDKPYAKDVWASTRDALDHHTRAWVEQYQSTCEATHIRREQSERLLDLRMDCLGERLEELSTLVAVFVKADEELMKSSVGAVHSLKPLSTCSDVRALTAIMRPPEQPARRQRAAELRQELARARGHMVALDEDRAAELVEGLVGDAEELAYWPLTAEVLLTRGQIRSLRNQATAAREDLDRAVLAAFAGGHEQVAAEALTRLVRVVGYQKADFDGGHDYAAHARAVLGRSNGGPWLEAELADYEGLLYYQTGDFEKALEQHRLALAERRQQSPDIDTPAIGSTLLRLGNVHLALGALDSALSDFEQALVVYEHAYGPSHPQVAFSLDKIGSVRMQMSDYQEAHDFHRRAVAVGEKALGPSNGQVASARLNLGIALHYLGRHDEALATAERALEGFRAAWGARHPQVSFGLGGLAIILGGAGRHAEARDAYSEALEIQQGAYGADHPWVANTVYNLGEAHRRLGEYRAAIDFYRRARQVFQQAFGDEHVQVANALTGEGRCLLALGDPDRAIESLERALPIRIAVDSSPTRLAETRFALARALAASANEGGRGSQPPERAVELAEQALEGYRQATDRYRPELEEVEAWLSNLGTSGSAPLLR